MAQSARAAVASEHANRALGGSSTPPGKPRLAGRAAAVASEGTESCAAAPSEPVEAQPTLVVDHGFGGAYGLPEPTQNPGVGSHVGRRVHSAGQAVGLLLLLLLLLLTLLLLLLTTTTNYNY